MWSDSLLLVASLDRNIHAIRIEKEPRVVWDENQKGGIPASPLALGARIVIVESGTEGRLVALDRSTRR